MSQWLMLSFTCPEHGEFESLTDKREGPAVSELCACGEPSPVVSSYAVHGRLKLGEVSQGKRHTADIPPWVMNTESLGDGEPTEDWKKRETKRLRDLKPRKRSKIMVSG